MLIRKPSDVLPSEITPESVWRRRRRLLAGAGAAAAGLAAQGWPARAARAAGADGAEGAGAFSARRNPDYVLMDEPTPEDDITHYNNFYEFGTDKGDPARHAGSLQTRPWTVSVEGEAARPRTFDIDDLLRLAPMEERIYRLRCVEAWSMVIPWAGYPLAALLKAVEPTANAKYVQFETALQRGNMPGVRYPVIDWPYVEGLRMDEAMHPLTLLVFGLYGKVLPNQNGAPLRLAVPWKYGFKSAKSIVRIRLVAQQPVSSWMASAPDEYGFYANVNPEVSHPRWSQATERRIGEDGFFSPKRKTLMFNGYADQVASLYQGMDLARDY